ncbi:MAG: SMP-30/gluconolactonase/LRE family protein [Candidatus Eutrophobiaceae bacterium]
MFVKSVFNSAHRCFLLAVLLGLFSCSDDEPPPSSPTPPTPPTPESVAEDSSAKRDFNLRMVWEKDGFSRPESMLYDAERDRIYVSNIGAGGSLDHGLDGFISVLDTQGNVIDMRWITDLKAPKGMAISGSKLYISDLDSIAVVALADSRVERLWPVQDAGFVNDVATAQDGRVFISDMSKDRIYEIVPGEMISVFHEGSELENPNGLYVDGNKLYIASWGVMNPDFTTDVPGHLKVMDLTDKSIQSYGTNAPIGNLDGLELIDGGDFIATDWMAGTLIAIDSEGTVRELLKQQKGTADIGYIKEKNLILLPLMEQGKVQAWELY